MTEDLVVLLEITSVSSLTNLVNDIIEKLMRAMLSDYPSSEDKERESRSSFRLLVVQVTDSIKYILGFFLAIELSKHWADALDS